MFKSIKAYFQKRHEKHYKDSRFHLVADIILVVTVIGLAAIFFYIRHYRPLNAVSLKAVSANEQIYSGRSETFEISYYANRKISDGALAVVLPEGFILEKAEPADIFNKNTNTFNIGSLSRHSNGRVMIQGIVQGELGARQLLAYNMECSRCGSDQLDSFSYDIANSTINSEISMPKEVYKDVAFNAHITITNSGDLDESNLYINVSGPWDWSKNDFIKDGEWKIDSLKMGEKKEFDLLLTPKEDNGDKELALAISKDLAGRRVRQAAIAASTSVKVPEVSISIVPKSNIAKDGESLSYQIFAENRGQNKISNFKILLDSGNKNFSLDKIAPIDKDTIVSGQALVFKDVNPGSRASAAIKVNFKRQNIAVNESLSLKLAASYESAGRLFSYELISPVTKLASNISVKSRAYYYSPQGDQLGIGPIPPMADMATDYWVFWELNNFGNALSNFTITADLPEGVIWTDNTNVLGGKLMHGQIGGRVIWQIDNVVADPASYQGQQQPVYKAGFDLGIIPSVTDIGKVISLLKNTKYSAHDTFTGEEVSGWLKDLDTNLEFDRLGAGKGAVIENQ